MPHIALLEQQLLPDCYEAQDVRRTPFFLQSQGRWLFAWLHRPAPEADHAHGVVLCPPAGHEYAHSHRTYRVLADQLARAGLSVLRFDPVGVGDSEGTEEQWGVSAWVSNIRDACGWLERQLSCQRMSLFGLRLGASLATLAASEFHVDSLVLWSAIQKGRVYTRELKALSAGNSGSAAEGTDLEAAGARFTATLLSEIQKLDLLSLQPRCRRAFILDREEFTTGTPLREAFVTQGIATVYGSFPGYSQMMCEPHESQIPMEVVNTTVRWLGEASSEGAHATHNAPHELKDPFRDLFRGFISSEKSLIERPVFLSGSPPLFGLLSAPAYPVGPELPAVVLLNGGSTHRVGPHQLHVLLARRLAAEGFPCLRLDLGGVGDSVPIGALDDNNPYRRDAFSDVTRTLHYLESLGSTRVVLAGLCSGACTAFQAAVRLPHLALVEALLINPLRYHWNPDEPLDSGPLTQIKATTQIWSSAWQPAKWLRLFSGKSKLGVVGITRLLVEQVRQRLFGTCFGKTSSADSLATDLQQIHQIGRRLSCFFSRSDPGYPLLTNYAPRATAALQQSNCMSLHFIEDADHTFSKSTHREDLIHQIIKHLKNRYCG